jgi:hypothetical protein
VILDVDVTELNELLLLFAIFFGLKLKDSAGLMSTYEPVLIFGYM